MGGRVPTMRAGRGLPCPYECNTRNASSQCCGSKLYVS